MTQPLLLEPNDLQNWNGVIVDVRSPNRYAQGHIPGAVNLPQAAIREQRGPATFVTEPTVFSQRVGAVGIDENTPVAIYGEGPQPEAGYLLWALSYYGHNDVHILNGGLGAWTASGADSSTEAPQPTAKTFTPSQQDDLRAMLGWVVAHLNNDDVKILDNRSAGEYHGHDVYAQRGGHLPSGIHLDWMLMLDENLRFKSEADLRALFEQAGLTSEKTAIIHCQTGSRTGIVYAALKLIGHENVRLYDGSWSEWGNHPDLPIE